MLPSLGRSGLVLSLLVLTSLVCLAVQPPAERPLALPAVNLLTAGSGWKVQATEASGWGMVYRQWTLRAVDGRDAFLYLAVTGSVKTLVHWSGDLGYEGGGYLVRQRSEQALQWTNGATVQVTVVRIQRMNDQRVLVYAVVSPDDIAAHGTDHLLRTGWEVLRGTAGPYYLVRVTLPDAHQGLGGEATALKLLAQVLPLLQAQLHVVAR